MANQGRKRFPMESLGESRVRIGGRFKPNGSSAIDATASEGTSGWTVAYTSTGLYTITLSDVWLYAFDKSLSLSMTADADGDLNWGVIDLAARTLQVRHKLAGTLADIAAAAGNFIDFGITVKRSANTGKR
jgi:hypothetical protein